MIKVLSSLTGFLLAGILMTSCKKSNGDDEKQPTTPVDNNIVETRAAVQTSVPATPIGGAISGYYQALPWYYFATTKSYPLIISFPGGGQTGNGTTDLPLVLNDGLAKLLSQKKLPPSFSVNGNAYSFIVLTPQLTKYPSNEDIKAFIDYAIQHFRIDNSHIYLTGLSIGGSISADVAAAYPGLIAAIAPMSGESQSMASCQQLANNHIPVWDFHNSGDPTVNISQSNTFIGWINSFHPAIAPRQTVFQSNVHDSWTKALDPSYKENNMNVYEWMLQYAK
jgi:predicted peptidase